MSGFALATYKDVTGQRQDRRHRPGRFRSATRNDRERAPVLSSSPLRARPQVPLPTGSGQA